MIREKHFRILYPRLTQRKRNRACKLPQTHPLVLVTWVLPVQINAVKAVLYAKRDHGFRERATFFFTQGHLWEVRRPPGPAETDHQPRAVCLCVRMREAHHVRVREPVQASEFAVHGGFQGKQHEVRHPRDCSVPINRPETVLGKVPHDFERLFAGGPPDAQRREQQDEHQRKCAPRRSHAREE